MSSKDFVNVCCSGFLKVPVAFLLASLMGFPSVAVELTNKDAAKENVNGAVGFGGTGLAAWALEKNNQKYGWVDKFSTNAPYSKPLASQLEDSDITRIVDSLRDSPTYRAGVGTAGGGQLFITLDNEQLDRLHGMQNFKETAAAGGQLANGVSNINTTTIRTGPASGIYTATAAVDAAATHKPNLTKTTVINLRTTSLKELESTLQRLRDSKILVSEITYKTAAGRLLTWAAPKVFNSLMYLGAGLTVERLLAAGYYGIKSDGLYCGPKHVCEKPSWEKRVFDGAAETGYEANSASKKSNREEGPAN